MPSKIASEEPFLALLVQNGNFQNLYNQNLCDRQLTIAPGTQGARHMKDFPHASFPPETVALMTTAMDAALSRLPHPVNSAHVKSIAETILRSAQEGERDPAALERMAFLELMITPRDD